MKEYFQSLYSESLFFILYQGQTDIGKLHIDGVSLSQKVGVSLLNSIVSVDDDGWMICDFTSFSTVFQSYQDDGQLRKTI